MACLPMMDSSVLVEDYFASYISTSSDNESLIWT